MLFRSVSQSRYIKLVPPKQGDAWLGLDVLKGQIPDKFVEITKIFIDVIEVHASAKPDQERLTTLGKKMSLAVLEFEALAKAENPDLYADLAKINAEVHYNHFHPFQWAWIFYLLSALVCFAAWIFSYQKMYPAAWVLTLIGVGLHIYGFALMSLS